MKRLAGLVATVLASVVLAAGCSNTGDTSGKISVKAATALAPYIQAVRTAVTAKHAGPMDSAIDQLRAEVATLQQRGELTAGRAANIDNAADALLTDFKAALPTPSPTVTSTSPTPSVSSTSPTPTPTVTVTVTPTQSTTPTKSSSSTASP